LEVEKEDSRTALICAVIANSNRSKKGKKFKPEDFMPKSREKRDDWRSQLKYVEMLNVAMGGVDKRSGDK